MPTARSEAELYQMLAAPLQKATDYVVQKIWNENREIVRVVVYEAYHPTAYNRSGEFKEAWNYTSGSHNLRRGSTATSEFYYSPESMNMGSPYHYASNYGQHIGVAGDYFNVDARQYLADIIYGAIKWGGAFGDGFPRQRDAWKALNKRIGRRKIKQWMKEGMQMAGLNVKMHNTPLHVEES